MNWLIKDEGYDPSQVADQGNRFLIGNGYMGVRGTLEEQRKDDLVAVNLAGIYDQVGDGWREPLNAPNPFYTTWAIDGESLHVNDEKRTAHYQALDYRYGLRKRSTRWRTASGAGITVISERFISLSDAHQLMMSMTFEADQDCSLALTSWIDGDVWDIYGPHYEKYDCELNDEYLAMTGHVQKSDKKVAVVRRDLFLGTEEQKAQFENWQPVEEPLYGDGGKKLKQQSPNSNKLIEQFDGYFKLEDTRPDVLRSRLVDPREYWGGSTGVATDSQVIKQADVVTMMAMFPQEYDTATMKANWDYYEPRTEHGSSLSACMYALLACQFGDSERAFPFFLKSATAEIRGGGKQWAGLVYIGGTHPASAGGAWKNIVEGFAGLKIEGDNLNIHPVLPSHWKSLKFPIVYKGRLHQVNITHENYHVSEVKEFMYD